VLPEVGSDPGLLVYRSFSKAFGLAGIRIGCVVADPDVIARLVPVRRFMPIDAVSLNAAAGVLQDNDFITRLTTYVLSARPVLAAILRNSGEFAEVRETKANFVLARLRDDAAELLDRLGRARIRVKHCDSLGLTGWIRISVGSDQEHRRLADCLGATVVSA
jgi:histidinol-phosphate/aromatic aminotransferase/cobyric acid decarboxylase-like protein